MNGFITWPEEVVCHRAMADIARELQGQISNHDSHKESQQGSRDTLDQANAEEFEQRLRKISKRLHTAKDIRHWGAERVLHVAQAHPAGCELPSPECPRPPRRLLHAEMTSAPVVKSL
ncbi:hypothetical protein [Bradyrhizobium murdochi]|uniref:hypothetical protein n=1 Tax=Bradyrhizobium murdochi TaxID=1038859 RepID=UPI00048CAC88|nr:hypothetical protein [Bradyrhizobium murdochi]